MNFNRIFKVCLTVAIIATMNYDDDEHKANDSVKQIEQSYVHLNNTIASINQTRHHVSVRLKFQDYPYGNGHICSGALISRSSVLTAGRCVYNYRTRSLRHPSEMKIVMGSLDRFESIYNCLSFTVTHIFTLRSFKPNSWSENIAILSLNRDVSELLYEHINPIPLMKPRDFWNIKFGDIFQTTTWVQTIKGVNIPKLLMIQAEYIGDNYCKNYHHHDTYYFEELICINYNGNAVENFRKDMGSPLLVADKLIGLNIRYHDVNTSVSFYINVVHHYAWIKSIIGDGSNRNGFVTGASLFIIFTIITYRCMTIDKD